MYQLSFLLAFHHFKTIGERHGYKFQYLVAEHCQGLYYKKSIIYISDILRQGVLIFHSTYRFWFGMWCICPPIKISNIKISAPNIHIHRYLSQCNLGDIADLSVINLEDRPNKSKTWIGIYYKTIKLYSP